MRKYPSNYQHKFISLAVGLVVVVCVALATQRSVTPVASNQTSHTPSPSAATGKTVPASAVLGARTQTTGCHVNGPFPDPACTPGASFSGITAAKVCTKGYSSSVRDVSASEKDAVYAEYGITNHAAGQYEVDHLVSLELGGSNDISNLWPEAASPTPGFHEKDKVENYLHDQVCAGKMTLSDAQGQEATNWLGFYDNVATPPPSTR